MLFQSLYMISMHKLSAIIPYIKRFYMNFFNGSIFGGFYAALISTNYYKPTITVDPLFFNFKKINRNDS